MLGVNLFNANQYQPFNSLRNSGREAGGLATATNGADFHGHQSDPMARVQSVLNHRLSETLGPPDRVVSHNGHETAFDAESIANNILSMVQNRLNQAASEGADPAQLNALREQAKTGIEQGITEAREILEKLDMLSSPVEEGITQLQNLLSQGLEPTSDGAAGLGKTNLIEAMQQFTQSMETSFEMEIKTQDGDQVKLHFSQLETQQDSFTYQATADGEVLQTGHIASSRSHFALSVEGELDEAELSAIADLANNIQQLSERFFAGDTQAAFEQGLQLGYDTAQIAGFALELQQSQTSSAVMKYQQISELNGHNNPQLPGLLQVRELLGEITGLLDQAAGLVESAAQVTKDMLGGFLSHHPRAGEFAARFHGRDEVGWEKLAETLVDQADRGPTVDEPDSPKVDTESEFA